MLRLKNHYDKTKIYNFLTSTYKFPSIEIFYYDFDASISFLEVSGKNDEGFSFNSMPYNYEKILESSMKSAQKSISPLKSEKKEYDKLLYKLSSLREEFSSQYDDLISDMHSEKRNSYNSKADSLLDEMRKLGIEKFSEEIKITELPKDEEDTDYLEIIMEAFDDNSMKVNDYLAYIENEIDTLSFKPKKIEKDSLPTYGNWKYLFVGLDSDLNPTEIKSSEEAFSLDKRQGLLFVQQKIEDYDLGFECAAIHGFLVSKGQICNRIAKLVPHFGGQSIEEHFKRSITIPVNNWNDDIREDVDNYFQENEDFLLSEFPDEYSESINSVDKEYDDISLVNNHICKSNGRKMHINSYSYIYDDADQLDEEIVNMLSNSSQLKNIVDNILLISDVGLFQDGIAIPSKLDSIFPMGLFRIKCNLTANSRMKLNITRHNTSGLVSDVDDWFEKAGCTIQDKLLSGLMPSLKELAVYIENIHDLIWPEMDNETYFQRKAWEEFQFISLTASKYLRN